MSNPAVTAPRRGGVARHLTLLTAMLGLTACNEAHPGEGQGGPPGGAPPPPEVSVVTVKRQAVPLTSELPGRTAPYLVAEVRPQVGGLILTRAFQEGADVAAGDLLYQIDPASYEIAVAVAKAALQRAEAAVATASASASRIAKLADKGITSAQAHDDAAGAVRAGRADIAAARAALAGAALDLERTRVLAPIAGRVSRSSVNQGALVTPFQTNLATVQQLDPIYVDITRPAVEVLRLQRALAAGQVARPDGASDLDGAPVRLLLEDGTAYPHAGRLQFTDATVTADTGAVTLRAVFPNPDQQLLPGMYVRAVLEEGVAQGAILVPQQGVTRDASGQATALVVNAQGLVEPRVLKTARTVGDQWLVTEGVSDGDRVIVEGLQKVQPGAPAVAVPFQPSPSAGDAGAPPGGANPDGGAPPAAPGPAPDAGAAAPDADTTP